MIAVRGVSKWFGGIHAVRDVSLEIGKGTITGLIGPNGAGKTTLFNIVAGHYRPSAGQVFLDGQDVTGLPPHALFKRGLLRTFQLAQEFESLPVRENLMMVPPEQPGEDLAATWFRPGRVAAREREIRDKADRVLDFLTLSGLAEERAANLSGGQKKLLELGRTMMVDAKIVFLDEVGAGVNRTLLATIGDVIQRLHRDEGYTFCMIEHDMDFIQRLCHPVIVMAEGAVLAEGSASEIMANEAVIEAYLGTGAKHERPGTKGTA